MNALRSRLVALLAAIAAAIALIGECVTPEIERWELIVTAAVVVVLGLVDGLGGPLMLTRRMDPQLIVAQQIIRTLKQWEAEQLRYN